MAILRLKELMKEKGMAREELAEKVGVSVTTISNINSEKNYPTIPLLISIAKVLDVDVREMFIPTKGGTLSRSGVDELKVLLKNGIEILETL